MNNFFLRIVKNIPYLMNILYAISYLLGLILIIRGIITLKTYGMQRSAMMGPNKFSVPIILILCGVLLIHLKNATVFLIMDAFFGNPLLDDLSYVETNIFGDVIFAAKNFMRFIGYISLFRGILQLSSADPNRNPISKALTHIIAGALAINIQTTFHILSSFLH